MTDYLEFVGRIEDITKKVQSKFVEMLMLSRYRWGVFEKVGDVELGKRIFDFGSAVDNPEIARIDLITSGSELAVVSPPFVIHILPQILPFPLSLFSTEWRAICATEIKVSGIEPELVPRLDALGAALDALASTVEISWIRFDMKGTALDLVLHAVRGQLIRVGTLVGEPPNFVNRFSDRSFERGLSTRAQSIRIALNEERDSNEVLTKIETAIIERLKNRANCLGQAGSELT